MSPRLIAALAALPAAVLVACSSTGGSQEQPAPSTTGRTPVVTVAPTPEVSDPAEVPDPAEVFIGALGGPADGHPAGGVTTILDHTVCSSLLRQPPCPPEAIPGDVQDEIVAAFGGTVRFVAEPPDHPEQTRQVVLTFGPPRINGDRATITVETQCGPLCGQGDTVVLHKRGDGWVRTGTEGPSWIS